MSHFSSFCGQSVVLRAFEPDDVPALHTYLNHPELAGCRYIPWEYSDEIPLSLKQVGQICERWGSREGGFALAITLKGSGVLIGHANCSWHWDMHCPHLNLVIGPEHQRQGYGSEVAQLLLRFLFETLPAHTVEAGYASWNEQAKGFARHLGFTENGATRWAGIRQGRTYDQVFATILRREWQERVKGEFDAA